MPRAVLIVMDSFGIGGAPDADAFGDAGSNTLGHIVAACAAGDGDRQGVRHGPLQMPNMAALGLFDALAMASDVKNHNHQSAGLGGTFHGAANETSKGKDTPSGHWEIAGYPVTFDWGYFPHTIPAMPQTLLDAIYADAGIEGSLGNYHASGTDILTALGQDHIRTGLPIFYTSIDSVLQIAAHEALFGLQRLYDLCKTAKRHTDVLNIGRVIARPFVGSSAADFERTGNRRDFAIAPPQPTVLNRIEDCGGKVIAIGKIGDIFAHSGVSQVRKAHGNAAVGAQTLAALADASDGDLVFANFVDFDMLYGHRRDVAGYAAALEWFDAWLPTCLAALRPDDLLIITADHGCDPTWTGTDHTRERVPVLGRLGKDAGPVNIGIRPTFADIAETIAQHLAIEPGQPGRSFLDQIAADA